MPLFRAYSVRSSCWDSDATCPTASSPTRRESGPSSEHDRECMYLTCFSLVGHFGSHLDACLGIEELIIAYARLMSLLEVPHLVRCSN